MSTAVPTPYDIVEPPPGPIMPSLSAWGVLALLIILFFLVRWLASRKQRSPSLQRIVTSLADELRRASSNVESSTSVERITRLTRRIISMYIPQETDSLSSHELRTLATSLSGSSLEQSRSLGSILNLLASLEDIAYAPLGLQTQQQEHVLQIQQSIDQLVRRHPLR